LNYFPYLSGLISLVSDQSVNMRVGTKPLIYIRTLYWINVNLL